MRQKDTKSNGTAASIPPSGGRGQTGAFAPGAAEKWSESRPDHCQGVRKFPPSIAALTRDNGGVAARGVLPFVAELNQELIGSDDGAGELARQR